MDYPFIMDLLVEVRICRLRCRQDTPCPIIDITTAKVARACSPYLYKAQTELSYV